MADILINDGSTGQDCCGQDSQTVLWTEGDYGGEEECQQEDDGDLAMSHQDSQLSARPTSGPEDLVSLLVLPAQCLDQPPPQASARSDNLGWGRSHGSPGHTSPLLLLLHLNNPLSGVGAVRNDVMLAIEASNENLQLFTWSLLLLDASNENIQPITIRPTRFSPSETSLLLKMTISPELS